MGNLGDCVLFFLQVCVECGLAHGYVQFRQVRLVCGGNDSFKASYKLFLKIEGEVFVVRILFRILVFAQVGNHLHFPDGLQGYDLLFPLGDGPVKYGVYKRKIGFCISVYLRVLNH